MQTTGSERPRKGKKKISSWLSPLMLPCSLFFESPIFQLACCHQSPLIPWVPTTVDVKVERHGQMLSRKVWFLLHRRCFSASWGLQVSFIGGEIIYSHSTFQPTLSGHLTFAPHLHWLWEKGKTKTQTNKRQDIEDCRDGQLKSLNLDVHQFSEQGCSSVFCVLWSLLGNLKKRSWWP